MSKTHASRSLDGPGIQYELRDCAVDLDDLSAPSVAMKIGMPGAEVFNTLLVSTGGSE